MPGKLTDTERHQLRQQAISIYRAAIDAVDPARLIRRHLRREGDCAVITDAAGTCLRRWPLPIVAVGAGKASTRMAAACEDVLGADQVSGIVVAPAGDTDRSRSIEVAPGGHPLPSPEGLESTRRLIDTVRASRRPILALVSGGASSLLVQPRAPITLTDKIAATRLLLACGSSIEELNTVRKHLSLVKGGGLLRAAATDIEIAALVLSDVVGDAFGTIASGPTAADPTTFQDTWDILAKYRLLERVPASVVEVLSAGCAGRERESVKPNDVVAQRCLNLLVGSNRIALAAARDRAVELDWHAMVEDVPITGDTRAAAAAFVGSIAPGSERAQPTCLLAGGETTVRVTGSGRGGRNQEFALAALAALSGSRCLMLSAGTDGIDGPTDAAGAFVDGTSAERATTRHLDAAAYLADNDSYAFFERLVDLYLPGATGTNVMDIKIVLMSPAGP